MATIRDVASYAKVSAATVSHVINSTRFVDPRTVERVKDAIDALNYRPNSLARSLRGHKTKTIGMLIPDNANPFFADIARAIEDTGFDQGYNVILCNSDGSSSKEAAYLDTLLSKQVDGLILISSGNSSDAVNLILQANVPVVVVDRELGDMPVDQVLIDNEQGGYQAGRYLLSLGHRRMGCIVGPNSLTLSAYRITGFRRALAEAGVALPAEAVIRGDFQYSGGEAAMTEFLRRGLALTAVFAANDPMAIGAVTALRRATIRVPEEVSVIGFDNILEASAMYPSITTIAQPVAEMGQIGLSLLLDRIHTENTEPARRVILTTKLIERESCRAPEAARRSGVLNRPLAQLIQSMRPAEMLIIGGEGVPVPEGVPCIDLAVTLGAPAVIDVVHALAGNLDADRLLITHELQQHNGSLPIAVQAAFPWATLERVGLEVFRALSASARVVVRTGDSLPYAQVMIYQRSIVA